MQDLDYYLEEAQSSYYNEGVMENIKVALGLSGKEIAGIFTLMTLLSGTLVGGVAYIAKHGDDKLKNFNDGKTVTVTYDPTPRKAGISHRGKLGIGVGGGLQIDTDGKLGIALTNNSKKIKIKMKLIIDKNADKISVERTEDLVTVTSPHKLKHSDIRKIRKDLK